MKKINLIILALLFSITANAQEAQPHKIILKLKQASCTACTALASVSTTGDPRVDAVSKQYGAVNIRRMVPGRKSHSYLYIVSFPEHTALEPILKAYQQTDNVIIAEPDYIATGGGQPFTPNDAKYGRQWSLHNNGTFSLSQAVAGADIDMENAWGIERGDTGIIVAVIDGGAKLDHPEFAGRIWQNRHEIPNDGIDNDNNGFIDDVTGWNFAYSNNNVADDYGHGTNVAGIVGANGNNSIGYSGVDMFCKLMIIKSLNASNAGDYSWMADAIYYATDNGARVINMSIGGPTPSTIMQNAVNYAVAAKVTVVICMMNTNTSQPYYPAACTGVIAVGSTNPNDKRSRPFFWDPASGSNYGSHISVVAPGNYIYGLSYNSNTNYESYWGGTSQAAPHVAGVASLLVAQDPTRTPAQIKQILENTAEDRVGDPAEDVQGWDQYFGHGRINAYRALGGTTGIISQVNTPADFSVYPNPSNGVLHVKFTHPGAYSCKLINAAGQEVFRTSVNGADLNIDKQLAAGIYTLTVKAGDQYEVKKVTVL